MCPFEASEIEILLSSDQHQDDVRLQFIRIFIPIRCVRPNSRVTELRCYNIAKEAEYEYDKYDGTGCDYALQQK